MSNSPPTKWKLPQMGYKKLNTDGSWKRESNAGGGAIRNDDGSWLVGFTLKLREISPEAAKLITIREGLVAAKKFNLHHLELEIDAKALQKMLVNAEDSLNHELGMIIQDIKEMLE